MKKFIIPVILVLVMALVVQFPRWMISPGELTQGHANLNDACLACHQPFAGVTNENCIACHRLDGIGRDSLQEAGVHRQAEPVLFHQGLGDQACTDCHVDHRGAQSTIAGMQFQHTMLTSAVLNNCVNCHQKPQDAFHPNVGDNCAKCHTTAQWLPSTFDHSKYFVLEGPHKTKCTTCHATNDFATYTCYGCHAHTEANILAEHQEEGITNITDCARCHRSANEEEIRRIEDRNSEINPDEANRVRDYIQDNGEDED